MSGQLVPPEDPNEQTLPGVGAAFRRRVEPPVYDQARAPYDQAAPPMVPKAPRIADPVRYEPDGTVAREPAHARSTDDEDDATWHPSTPKRVRRRRPARHRRHEKKPQRSLLKELPILVVTALVLTVLIQTLFARVYMIPSASMETTLHGCPGCTPDRVLVDKVTYHFTDPKPGDVVVFEGPPAWTEDSTADPPPGGIAGFVQQLGGLVGLAPADQRDFVKRIIAVGGQTVQCCDKQNRVLVNGKPINELAYLHLPQGQQQASFKPVKVPAGKVFVMGDNRNNSSDSRYQGGGGVNGTVPVDDIIGKARFIVLPVSRWNSITDINPQTN